MPTLLLTRRLAQSRLFLSQLIQAGGRMDAIISPLMEIVRLTPARDPAAYPTLILTSANALVALGMRLELTGRRAFCVGVATAIAARGAGLEATAAAGDADALVATVLAARPEGPALHLRGVYARGDVAARLTAAGLPTDEAVIYDQRALPISDEARARLAEAEPVVAPLFSPRTATLLAAAGPFAAPVHVVAMSGAVATAYAAAGGAAASTTVAAAPEAQAMVAATLRALADRG